MHKCTILGISYAGGTCAEVVSAGLKAGLVVIPSAPVILRMTEDAAHREALLGADLAVADSGFMVLLWRLFTGGRLIRVSGLAYLASLLDQSALRSKGEVVWVMPTVEARDRNLAWLRSKGQPVTAEDCYLAPIYPKAGPLEDARLCEWIRLRKPRHIVIALGGGVQERLGWSLKQNISGGLRIHCVGAAIGFLSGDQVGIPAWADRYFLGWLCRCASRPRLYVPRYFKALRLIPLMWRYRSKLPPLRTGAGTGRMDSGGP
jgi:UDP-N-acetyl-D-mannosaminuronic acid transferase (WecB/TagA/CpsF family)